MHRPIVRFSDIGPFPSIFVAKMDILISVEGEQDEIETFNTSVHWVFNPQDTAKTVFESQITPVAESE